MTHLTKSTIVRRRDHSPKSLAQVKRPAGDESPRLRGTGAADFRRALARIGRERAAGAVALV